MGTFFKGWRRKFGVVALGLACVFAAGWLRSTYRYDHLCVCAGDSSINLLSLRGQLEILESSRSNRRPSDESFCYESYRLDEDVLFGFWDESEFKQPLRLFGFRFGMNPTSCVCVLPLSSIVVPLTLLSAWLLISTPRQKPNQLVVHA